MRRWRVQLTHLHADVEFGDGVYCGPGFRVEIPGNGALIVGPRVHFRRGFTAEIAGGGRVTIGADTIFTWDPVIHCSTTVDIGEGCMIGRVVMADGNHRFRDPDQPVLAQGYDFHPLVIGDGAMIANHAVVLASVGERTFVGANAVVSRDLPDYSVAVGQPARVVEYFGKDPQRRLSERPSG